MRTVDVVKALRGGESVAADALAERFDASVRTVRSHIHQANEQLNGIAHIAYSRRRAGYVMEVANPVALDVWIERAAALGGEGTASSERVAYLLNDLLQRNDWVTINTLADLLFASPQSISNDLHTVKEVLERYGLALEARPRYGVRVMGPEMPRRLCLASIVSKSLVTNGPLSWDNDQDQMVKRVASCIDEALDASDLSISYGAFQNLTVHICVAIARLRNDAVVPLDEHQLEALRHSAEFPVARAIANSVSAAFSVVIPETEVAYIAIHLAGKKTLTQLVGVDPMAASNAISDEVWTVVGTMLDRVWGSFHIDFRNDIELRMNLARHLAPLAVRLTYGLRLENPLLMEIKTRYPLAYSIAVDASGTLADRYGSDISEDEIGYLALAFALALERQRTGASKKNVLIVCASGMGTARMLEHHFRSAFEGYIDQIATCDVHDVVAQDFTKIDYVFTAVPLGVQLPVPVCEISYFFDEADAGDIRRLLRARVLAGGGLIARFDRELFFPHLAIGSKWEAIEFLAARMGERFKLDEGFPDSVLAREQAAATSFGNLVAMPHPLKPASDVTHVCVGLLDEPIPWDGGDLPVQAVFLISYARSGGRALDDFFGALADVFMDAQAIERLVKDQAWDVLTSILEGR